MTHAILLGDSVFDNRAYVTPAPDVVHQLRRRLGGSGEATLLAVDGNITRDVAARQLQRLPGDATHLIVSVGGNDALGHAGLLNAPARSIGEALERLADAQAVFATAYRVMLDAVAARRLPIAVCTIYDTHYPEPQGRRVNAALALFNDAITRLAFARGVGLIDLRLVCTDPADFANPIDPSEQGGDKIGAAIASFVAAGTEERGRSAVWI